MAARKWSGRVIQRQLDALRIMYAGNLICHLCGRIIVDHRYKPSCCPHPKELHWLTADHIIPQSKGGTHDLSNLRPAHHSCNSQRQDKPVKMRKPIEDNTDFFRN